MRVSADELLGVAVLGPVGGSSAQRGKTRLAATTLAQMLTLLFLLCSLGKGATQTKRRKAWRAARTASGAGEPSQLNRYTCPLPASLETHLVQPGMLLAGAPGFV